MSNDNIFQSAKVTFFYYINRIRVNLDVFQIVQHNKGTAKAERREEPDGKELKVYRETAGCLLIQNFYTIAK
jgi:hypothetical protein